MTWIKKVPPPHRCRKPMLLWTAVHGSIWECDDCKQQWIIIEHPDGWGWKKYAVIR